MLHWESGDMAVAPSWLCGLGQSLPFSGQFLIRGAKIMDGGKGIPSSSPQSLVLYFETICGAVLTEGLKKSDLVMCLLCLFSLSLFATSFPHTRRIQTLESSRFCCSPLLPEYEMKEFAVPWWSLRSSKPRAVRLSPLAWQDCQHGASLLESLMPTERAVF